MVLSFSRTPLSPTTSCYYQPYYKQLTCKCGPVDRVSSLILRREYFVQGAGNQVRVCSLHNNIYQCLRLKLSPSVPVLTCC